MVFFTSDNGGLSTSEGSPTSNLPLRGGKGWVYEGGIREPWIIRYPSVTKPGSVSSQMICSIDLLPTVASIVGSKFKHKVDGIDLTPAFKGQKLNREALYWHYPHYSNQGGIPGGAVRIADYKLFENYENGEVSLYNLKKDIGESKDLSSSEPKRVRDMRNKLHDWYKEVDAKFLQPKGESKNPWRP
jgi:arylsulfatase A-like enzyme